MNKDYFSERMIERLPRAMQSGLKIKTLMTAVAEELCLMNTGSKLLMQSRWYKYARGWNSPEAALAEKRESEIGRIAALFGLYPGREETVDDFKEKLKIYVQVHRDGLGNLHSIFRLAALVYRSESEPVIKVGNSIEAKFQVKTENNENKTIKLEIVENPEKKETANICGMETGKNYDIINNTLDYAIPEIIIKTSDENIVSVPMIVHKESGLRILYVGKLSKGAELRLENGKAPILLRNNSLQSGGFCFDSPDACFDSPSIEPRVRFGGPRILMVGGGSKFDQSSTCFGKVRFSAFDEDTSLPRLVPGVNRWYYRTIKKDELKTYLMGRDDIDELIKNAEEDPDEKPIDVIFQWKGKEAASFSLRIPEYYNPAFFTNFKELVTALNRMLQYGRAAGVKATVEPVVSFDDELCTYDTRLEIEAVSKQVEQFSSKDAFKTDISAKLDSKLNLDETFASEGIFDKSSYTSSIFSDAIIYEKGILEKSRFDRSLFCKTVKGKFNNTVFCSSVFV